MEILLLSYTNFENIDGSINKLHFNDRIGDTLQKCTNPNEVVTYTER